MKRICQCDLTEEIYLIEYPPIRDENGNLSCCDVCQGGEEFNEENVRKALGWLNDKIQEIIRE